jgi:hypothetical protein
MIRVVHPGSCTDFLPIPDPVVKKAPDPGSETAEGSLHYNIVMLMELKSGTVPYFPRTGTLPSIHPFPSELFHRNSFVDPHWFQCGSGIFGQSITGSRVLIKTEKITAKPFFNIKNCNLLIFMPRYRRPNYRKILHLTKKTPSTLEISSLFLVIFALLYPDPAEQNECGSGSGTLEGKCVFLPCMRRTAWRAVGEDPRCTATHPWKKKKI